MKVAKLDNMVKGWFVGNFAPTVYRTNAAEVAVKSYKAGDYEIAHYHKVATEITVIISGIVRMNGVEYTTGDIVVLEPNEVAEFLAITDAINAVVKIPGVNHDKYTLEE